MNAIAPVVLTALLLAAAAPLVAAQTANAVSGGEFEHVVKAGEMWSAIAARVGMEPQALAALNKQTLRSRLAAGQPLRVDNRHLVPQALASGIVINLPQRMLFLMADGKLVASYPVALGRSTWPTFVGPFTVVAKEVDPVWDVPPSIQEEWRQAGKPVVARIGPGPSNPLGKHWLGLSEPNFGIHGTNAPRSIYRFETHGCVRLHPDDIADLWSRVTVGTPGQIVYEPVLLHLQPERRVLLEVHRDVYHRESGSAESVVRAWSEALGVAHSIDWAKVRIVIGMRDGMPHVVSAASGAEFDSSAAHAGIVSAAHHFD